MMLASPIGIVLWGIVALIIGLALGFLVTAVLVRTDVIDSEHRGRWMLVIAPLALVVVGVVGYELI